MLRTEKVPKALRYGTHAITVDDFDLMISVQGHKCAICKESFGEKRKPNMDHNHKTGVLRGVLCGKCNSGLGFFRDNTQFLDSAIEYLRHHDACPRPSVALTPRPPVRRFGEAMRKLEGEERLMLRDATHLFPFKVSQQAIRNYVLKGRLPERLGGRIYLEAYRQCNGWVTSKEAVSRFLERINGAE